MAGIEFRAGGGAPTCVGLHCHGVPWLPDTKTVQIARLEVGHHLRWRDNSDAHVALRINAAGSEPLAQEMAMGREGKYCAEREHFLAAGSNDLFAERFGIPHPALPQIVR